MEIKQIRKERIKLEKEMFALIHRFEVSTKAPVESVRIISNSNNIAHSIVGYTQDVIISTKKVKLHNI